MKPDTIFWIAYALVIGSCLSFVAFVQVPRNLAIDKGVKQCEARGGQAYVRRDNVVLCWKPAL